MVDINAEIPVEVTAGKELTARPATQGMDVDRLARARRPSSGQTERERPVAGRLLRGHGRHRRARGLHDVPLMVHTSSVHGEFDDKVRAHPPSKECTDLADSGKSSQSAANVALVFTGVAALATIAIGVGFVNWRGSKRASSNPFVLTF